jgi:hypothetical protein
MWLVAVALLAIEVFPVVAQEQTPSDSLPLRVQVVLSRFEGEKRLSNLPYTMWVNATRDANKPVSLRMGVQVPVLSTSFTPAAGKEVSPTPLTSYSYRSVGTNIDCTAQIMVDGRFRLTFGIEQSAIVPDDPKKPTSGVMAGVAMFRQFNTNFVLTLRDGQSAQNTTATDPVSGEVLKIDVTMNVIK